MNFGGLSRELPKVHQYKPDTYITSYHQLKKVDFS